MKNYVQPGNVIPFAAPRALTPGEGFVVGGLFAVAVGAAANGAAVEGQTTGVFDLTANPADNITAGAKVYWDNAAFRVTITAGGNRLIGSATEAKAPTLTTVRVRLDGVSV